MLPQGLILGASIAYLLLLFAVAYYGDKRADSGRSIIANASIYSLSIAVYCTAWTFYGSVGRAASSGLDFLPIYLGPTLAAVLWWPVLRRMVRISKVNRITSIADFIASRYGKSPLLGGLVTVIAVVGIIPYIALQLKAVSTSYQVLSGYPELAMPEVFDPPPLLADTALHVAAVLALFAMLFGTRHIDATERHEGMVAAIAFESVVKLVAFLAVGLFATCVLFDSPADLFAEGSGRPEIARLFVSVGKDGYAGWVTLTLLSMAAIMLLPRQFQVAVVENVNENHLRTSAWLLPSYLLLINLFVLPIAVAGLLLFPGGAVHADTFVLALPMAAEWPMLALFVFIGGLSAATGMVIVETIALSTMLCNDLLMPILLRLRGLRLTERTDLSRLLISIRRVGIIAVLLLGYLYFRFVGESYALVTMGLISFAAVAQFAPVIIGGMIWKRATAKGALAGLAAGFVTWAYTLFLPAFTQSGWLPAAFLTEGPFGIALLKPYALFGLDGLDQLSHALFWSMTFNAGAYLGVSFVTRQSLIERIQATRFVEVFRHSEGPGAQPVWEGKAVLTELMELVGRFVGRRSAERAFQRYAAERGVPLAKLAKADVGLMGFAERLLAGAIGAASARVMVATAVKGEGVSLEKVMEILDESSRVIEYSHQLEAKSRELERASAELRAANERLQELDRLKDEFITTVTHELRTPLTSIRAFSEILYDKPGLPAEQRRDFLRVVIRESARLTRLINQLLDLAKIEAGRYDWRVDRVDVAAAVADAVDATGQLFEEKAIRLRTDLPDGPVPVWADRDQLIQVVINLLSNAVKFCDHGAGRVTVAVASAGGLARVSVADNGPGIPPRDRQRIFEKFHQGGDTLSAKPQGTGLGLAISRRIIEHFGGRIWVEDARGGGSRFVFTLPLATGAAAVTDRAVPATDPALAAADAPKPAAQ
jgi:Na+/proline symporter/nitrogen-specific signal transduction histidine kinase